MFPAPGRHHAQHHLVPLHQLPPLPAQQHAGDGQRPRGDRRGDRLAGPARRPPRRDRWARTSRSPRPTADRSRPSRARRRARSSTTRPRRPASTTPAGSPTACLPFAVNLFDFRESDLAPRGLVPEGVPESQAEAYKIKIGYNPVAGTRQIQGRDARLVEVPGGRRARGPAARMVHLQQARLYLRYLAEERSRRARASLRAIAEGMPGRSLTNAHLCVHRFSSTTSVIDARTCDLGRWNRVRLVTPTRAGRVPM